MKIRALVAEILAKWNWLFVIINFLCIFATFIKMNLFLDVYWFFTKAHNIKGDIYLTNVMHLRWFSLNKHFWQDLIGVTKITLLLKDPVFAKLPMLPQVKFNPSLTEISITLKFSAHPTNHTHQPTHPFDQPLITLPWR